MSVEKLSKVIPVHMRMVNKMLNQKQKRLFNEDASPVSIEAENEVLWEITQFLRDKLHDIQIDTIRHGLNHEDDYNWEYKKPSENPFD